MAYAGKHHGNAQFVGLLDGIFVAYAASGLDDGGDTVLRCKRYSVVEGQEAVGRKYQALGEARVPGLFERYLGGAYAVGLSGAYAYRVAVADYC